MGEFMEMNTRLNAGMADIRASLRAAYLQAKDVGDHAEMSRLNALAVEVDSLRAKLALGALDKVAKKVAAVRLGDLAGEDLVGEDFSVAGLEHQPARFGPGAIGGAVLPIARPTLLPVTGEQDERPIAWGAVTARKHGPTFNARVREIANGLHCDPSHLMAVMAFETGETFDPAQKNAADSGATGLIQFMPHTAHALGTSVSRLAAMTARRQLDFVKAYFDMVRPTGVTLAGLSDLYMAVLWPAAMGRDESHILFRTPSRAYTQNRGLDVNRDGVITKAEATSKVAAKLAKGMKSGRLG